MKSGSIIPSGFDPKDIAPPLLEERDWQINSLALDLSGRCNLACRYCAEAATQPAQRPGMSEEVLALALEFFSAHTSPGGFSSIRLGSGEPMLAKPLLRRIEQRLRRGGGAETGKQQVFITTNGTLLDSETRDWLVASGWNVKISLDGPAAIHDRWRVTPQGRPTYATVAAAVGDLSRRIPARFGVSAVICRGNDPASVFEGIADLGVPRIDLVPVGHPDPAIMPDQDDAARYREFALNYAERYVAGDRGLPALVKVINSARRVMGYDLKRLACGAGRTFFGVGPAGDFYPCFRFIGIEAFRLGNLSEGLEPVALEEFRQQTGRPYERRDDCRDCWAAPICGGPCFAEAALMGNNGRPLALHCEYVRANAEAAIALVQGLRRRDPERLLEILAGLVEL